MPIEEKRKHTGISLNWNYSKKYQFFIHKHHCAMYYEINVSLNGVHFFATSPRSITSKAELKKVYAIFKEKFPASEGYKLTVLLCETTKFPILEDNI
jgi:hypothetical protein